MSRRDDRPSRGVAPLLRRAVSAAVSLILAAALIYAFAVPVRAAEDLNWQRATEEKPIEPDFSNVKTVEEEAVRAWSADRTGYDGWNISECWFLFAYDDTSCYCIWNCNGSAKKYTFSHDVLLDMVRNQEATGFYVYYIPNDLIFHSAVSPSCEAAGSIEYWSSSDGTAYRDPAGREPIGADDIALPALGHDWDDGNTIREPTIFKEGLKNYTCRRDGCGAAKTEPVPRLSVFSASGEKTVRKIILTAALILLSSAIAVMIRIFSHRDRAAEVPAGQSPAGSRAPVEKIAENTPREQPSDAASAPEDAVSDDAVSPDNEPPAPEQSGEDGSQDSPGEEAAAAEEADRADVSATGACEPGGTEDAPAQLSGQPVRQPPEQPPAAARIIPGRSKMLRSVLSGIQPGSKRPGEYTADTADSAVTAGESPSVSESGTHPAQEASGRDAGARPGDGGTSLSAEAQSRSAAPYRPAAPERPSAPVTNGSGAPYRAAPYAASPPSAPAKPRPAPLPASPAPSGDPARPERGAAGNAAVSKAKTAAAAASVLIEKAGKALAAGAEKTGKTARAALGNAGRLAASGVRKAGAAASAGFEKLKGAAGDLKNGLKDRAVKSSHPPEAEAYVKEHIPAAEAVSRPPEEPPLPPAAAPQNEMPPVPRDGLPAAVSPDPGTQDEQPEEGAVSLDDRITGILEKSDMFTTGNIDSYISDAFDIDSLLELEDLDDDEFFSLLNDSEKKD